MIKAIAKDPYHNSIVEKIKRIVVGADMSDNNISIPSILDTEVNEGDTITFDASIQGATVRIGGNYPQTARVNGGQFTWTTQKVKQEFIMQ